ncbi:hypothetical protein ACFLQ1_02460 [Candidatus Auribacterota bacterium]
MAREITLKDVDELITHFSDDQDPSIPLLLKNIRFFYGKDEDLKKIRSIKSDDVILLLWPFQEVDLKKIKSYIKSKRKDLSHLKAAINHLSRDLFWENKNPLRIGVGRFNTFKVLKETKYEEVNKLRTEVQYLRSIVQEMAPGTMKKVKATSSMEVMEKIKEDLAKKQQEGAGFEERVTFEKDIKFLELDKKALSQEDVENSKLVINATEQSGKLADKLEALNQETQQVYADMESGKLSAAEGEKRLAGLNEERRKLGQIAKNLTETLSDIKEEDDPVLAKAVEKMKDSLKQLIEEKHITDESLIEELIEEGIKAIEEFEDGYKKDTKDDVEFKDKEAIEKEFFQLKEREPIVELDKYCLGKK